MTQESEYQDDLDLEDRYTGEARRSRDLPERRKSRSESPLTDYHLSALAPLGIDKAGLGGAA